MSTLSRLSLSALCLLGLTRPCHATDIAAGDSGQIRQVQMLHPPTLPCALVDALAGLPYPGRLEIVKITTSGKILLRFESDYGYVVIDQTNPSSCVVGYVWHRGVLSEIRTPAWPWTYPTGPDQHLYFTVTDMNDAGAVVGLAAANGPRPDETMGLVGYVEYLPIFWPADRPAQPRVLELGLPPFATRLAELDLVECDQTRIDDSGACYAKAIVRRLHTDYSVDWTYYQDVLKWTDPNSPPQNLTGNVAFTTGDENYRGYDYETPFWSQIWASSTAGALVLHHERDLITSFEAVLPSLRFNIPLQGSYTPLAILDDGRVIFQGSGTSSATLLREPNGATQILAGSYDTATGAGSVVTRLNTTRLFWSRPVDAADYTVRAMRGPGIDKLSSWQSRPPHLGPNGVLAYTSVLDVAMDGTPLPTAERSRVLLAVPASLSVDANRDGDLDDSDLNATSAASPFRFWSNDDDDDGDDKRSAADDIPLSEGDSKRDSENTKVDGIRDLEDFFPVFFDIKQLLTVLPPGTNGISYYLKQEDSALGAVFTSYTRTQAFDYLRGAPTALDTGFGPALTQNAGDAIVTKVTSAGVDITATSSAFFDQIKNNDGGVMLIEASKATIKPLVLEVRKGSTVIAELKLELKIDPVETMFHYVNLRSFAHGTPVASNNQGPGYGSTTPTAAPNDPFATIADRKNMVFIHGYNVNGEAARGSAATAFKRFYWSGSKAKFYAVIWRGDDGQGDGVAPAGSTPDYHRNVGHAWQDGPRFRDFLGALQGDTAIMAHSLGNVVTQVALTRTRDPNNNARLIPASKPATVKHYFAVDAAVPLEATSASDITNDSKSKLRHTWWAEYDGQERLWPSHWHELFAGTGDAREGLTWQNVFANLEIGTNFYSSGEEVLANPVDDGMPFWEPLFFAGQRAWVAQEKLKGGNGAAIAFFRSRTGGWVENEAWYVPLQPPIPEGVPPTRRRFASEAQDVAAPNGVPTSALASDPFFRRFQASEDGVFYPGYQGSRLHAPVGDANADDEARKLVTVAKCLGEAIPALSFPQGSNTATKFDDLSGNFDLNTSDFKNGWPASRGSNAGWKHSDCLDVSYIFHFKLYDRMKTDGGLR